jgi:hypothetical protein
MLRINYNTLSFKLDIYTDKVFGWEKLLFFIIFNSILSSGIFILKRKNFSI